MAWLRLIAMIWVALLLLPGVGEAQDLPDGRGVPICFARAAPAAPRPSDIAARLASPQGFDCHTRQRRLGSGDFWVRSGSLPAFAGTTPAFVRSASLWQQEATLAILYADGAIVTRRIDGVDAARSIALGAVFQQPIPVRGVRATRLLWHVRGAGNMRGIVVDVRIATLKQSIAADFIRGMLYSAFAGLSLALLMYNLSLWVVLRHRFQLAYSAMVVAMVAYAFTSSGAFSWLWPELGNNARIRLNYASLAVTTIAAIGFARHYFEPRVFNPFLRRTAWGVAAAIAISSTLVVVLSPWQARLLDRAVTLSFLAVLGFAVMLLARAWRVRSSYLWLFAITWAAPLALASVRVASGLALAPSNALLDSSTLMAMATESLLSSIAIVYRIRLLLVERDEARARETAARLLADSDPLTGLMNRRSFLREAIGRGERMLLVIDIDHFRSVNDTLGHDGGDEVLRRVSRVLRDVAPEGALVARLGGEEFAILCTADEPLDAEELLTAVRAAHMPFDLTVTVSLGSAIGPMEEETHWTRLYRRADEALYAAKRAGRDRARRAKSVPHAA